MKCCASPASPVAVGPAASERAAQTTMQALLFSEILKPLAKGLGPVSEVAVESVVQHLFASPAR